MTIRMHILAAGAIALLLTACKPADGNTTPPSVNGTGTADTSAQLERMKKETREAAQAVNDYAYAQRVEFADKMRAQLAAINTQLDQLTAKVESSTSTAREEAKAKIQALREQTAQLNTKLDGVKDSTESTWNDVKAGISQGYDSVKDSLNQARQWLSDKIAPASK